MELLREYQREHPEECVELNRLKENSARIEAERKERRAEHASMIEKWRRILYGNE